MRAHQIAVALSGGLIVGQVAAAPSPKQAREARVASTRVAKPGPPPAAKRAPVMDRAAGRDVDLDTDTDADRDAADRKARAALPDLPDGVDYKAWRRSLTKAERTRVTRFCRAHPVDYEPICNGIGPLAIPVPPSLVPQKAAPGEPRRSFDDALRSHDEWRASLTARQRRYVDDHCRQEELMYSTLCGATPLVVAFDSQPVEFSAGGSFAFLPGDPMASDWPTAATPWIARDLDGDGRITSGAELFGSNTRLPDGTAAKNGFLALAPLDDNRDGKLDAEDAAFASLLLWTDRDGDRQSTPDELAPLGRTVVSIALEHQLEIRCDARTNCERERGAMRWRDEHGVHAGSVVDVYLPRR